MHVKVSKKNYFNDQANKIHIKASFRLPQALFFQFLLFVKKTLKKQNKREPYYSDESEIFLLIYGFMGEVSCACLKYIWVEFKIFSKSTKEKNVCLVAVFREKKFKSRLSKIRGRQPLKNLK